MTRRGGARGAATAAAAAVLLGLGGCGSSGDDERPPSGPTAEQRKRVFVGAADRVCLEARRELAERGREGDGLTAVAAQARRTRRVAARTLDELRGLNPPAEGQAVLQRYFASIEDTVRTLLPAIERAARRGQRASVDELLAQVRERSAAQAQLARQYGFRVCGRTRG